MNNIVDKYKIRIRGSARGVMITKEVLKWGGQKIISTKEIKHGVWECVAEVYP